MWHVETDYFALIIFLVMLIKEHQNRRQLFDVQGRAFFLILVLSIFNVIVDIASSLAMNYLNEWLPYELIMTLYVATMPLLAAAWAGYAFALTHADQPVEKMRRGTVLLLIPYVLFVFVALTNPVTGLFFQLSPDMTYERGILFMPVGVGMIMFYSIVGLYLVLRNHKRITPRSNVVLLVLFFVVTVCFIWIQLANPGWLIINASYAAVYVWCDLTIEEGRRAKLVEEINRKNKELEVALKNAEAAAEAKTEFLSRMSHDIRTPMNAIIGLTYLARKEKDPKVVHEYLEKITTSSEFLLGLINDILDLSKIEKGELTLKKETLTRDSFIASVDTVIRPLMNNKHITFECDLTAGPGCIAVDRLRFNQIFFNLLSNAAKFTPEGGTVWFTLERLEPKDGKIGLHFSVRDTGPGIKEEFLEKIFNPFVQEESGFKAVDGGTGLGLPIVKSLVQAMGGTISVISEPGKGAEFCVDLYVDEANLEEKAPEQEHSYKCLKGARILVVEDNEINSEVARLILERAGCNVEIARDGFEAVKAFCDSSSSWFDAILMDVRMPTMDGLEATKAIRLLRRSDALSVPIIAMTADAFTEEQKRTIEAGMNSHLSKPINPALLYQSLAEYLEK